MEEDSRVNCGKVPEVVGISIVYASYYVVHVGLARHGCGGMAFRLLSFGRIADVALNGKSTPPHCDAEKNDDARISFLVLATCTTS